MLKVFWDRLYKRLLRITRKCMNIAKITPPINGTYGQSKKLKSFMEDTPISLSLQMGFKKKTVGKKREIMSSNISNVIFCGTHDLPLRGKQNEVDLCDKIIILCI